jgi:hypothetical protein
MRATVFVQGDICDRALLDRLLAEHRRAPSCTSPPKAMSTAASTAPATSSRPTSKAPSRCWKPRAPTGKRWTGSKKAFRFLHVSTDEVYGSLAPDAPAFTERTLRAQQPLQRQQGRQRPPGARLAPHLRPAGADHQLQQQLRALPLPRKAHPADDRQRPGRQAAAGVRRRPADPRLALRGDHCSAIRRCWSAAAGRDLQRRRLEREAQHRHRAHRLRAARRTAPRPTASPTRA